MPTTSSPEQSRICSPAARLSSSENGGAGQRDRSRSRARPVAGAYRHIDCGGVRERRRTSQRPSPSLGSNPHRGPVGFRSQCAERRTCGRDHFAGTHLWPADAVHVVRCGAGDRARPPSAGMTSTSRCRFQRACPTLPLALPAALNRTSCGCSRRGGARLRDRAAACGAGESGERSVKTKFCVLVCRGADRLGYEATLRRRARGRSVVDTESDGAAGWRHDRHNASRRSREKATSRASICS